MSDVLSNWAANTALQAMMNVPCYLALHLSDPTALGNPATEVAGGGYARQPISFSAATNRTRVSTNAQTFPGMPQSTVTHLSVWTAVSGGSMVFAKQLPSPIKVLESGQFLAAAGDVALSL